MSKLRNRPFFVPVFCLGEPKISRELTMTGKGLEFVRKDMIFPLLVSEGFLTNNLELNS